MFLLDCCLSVNEVKQLSLMFLCYVIQNGKQMVQEGALTALASVADSSQVPYVYNNRGIIG